MLKYIKNMIISVLVNGKGAKMKNEEKFLERIPTDFAYKIVKCLRDALEDDVIAYKESTKLATYNGLPFQKCDYINTHLQNDLSSTNIEVIPFKRFNWESRIVIDRTNKIAYSVISKNRLQQLIKNFNDATVPHYAVLFAYALNGDIEAPQKQIGIFDNYPYARDIMEEGYDKLLGGQVLRNEGYRYCIVTYEVNAGQLYSSEALFLDKDLDLIERVSLTEYIRPDYAKLTTQDETETEDKTQNKLRRVTLKKKIVNFDDSSLLVLKGEEEQKA